MQRTQQAAKIVAEVFLYSPINLQEHLCILEAERVTQFIVKWKIAWYVVLKQTKAYCRSSDAVW